MESHNTHNQHDIQRGNMNILPCNQSYLDVNNSYNNFNQNQPQGRSYTGNQPTDNNSESNLLCFSNILDKGEGLACDKDMGYKFDDQVHGFGFDDISLLGQRHRLMSIDNSFDNQRFLGYPEKSYGIHSKMQNGLYNSISQHNIEQTLYQTGDSHYYQQNYGQQHNQASGYQNQLHMDNNQHIRSQHIQSGLNDPMEDIQAHHQQIIPQASHDQRHYNHVYNDGNMLSQSNPYMSQNIHHQSQPQSQPMMSKYGHDQTMINPGHQQVQIQSMNLNKQEAVSSSRSYMKNVFEHQIPLKLQEIQQLQPDKKEVKSQLKQQQVYKSQNMKSYTEEQIAIMAVSKQKQKHNHHISKSKNNEDDQQHSSQYRSSSYNIPQEFTSNQIEQKQARWSNRQTSQNHQGPQQVQQYPPASAHYYDQASRPKTEVDAKLPAHSNQNKLYSQIKDTEKPSLIKTNNEDTNENKEPIFTNPIEAINEKEIVILDEPNEKSTINDPTPVSSRPGNKSIEFKPNSNAIKKKMQNVQIDLLQQQKRDSLKVIIKQESDVNMVKPQVKVIEQNGQNENNRGQEQVKEAQKANKNADSNQKLRQKSARLVIQISQKSEQNIDETIEDNQQTNQYEESVIHSTSMRLMESTINGRNQSHSNTRIKQMVKIDLSGKQAVQIKEQQSINLMQSEECTLALGSHQLQNNILIPSSPVEKKTETVIIPKISIQLAQNLVSNTQDVKKSSLEQAEPRMSKAKLRPNVLIEENQEIMPKGCEGERYPTLGQVLQTKLITVPNFNVVMNQQSGRITINTQQPPKEEVKKARDKNSIEMKMQQKIEQIESKFNKINEINKLKYGKTISNQMEHYNDKKNQQKQKELNKASIVYQQDEPLKALMNDDESQINQEWQILKVNPLQDSYFNSHRHYNQSPEITSVRAELDHHQINNEILDADSNIKRSICSSEESVKTNKAMLGKKQKTQNESKTKVSLNSIMQQNIQSPAKIEDINNSLDLKAVIPSMKPNQVQQREENAHMENEYQVGTYQFKEQEASQPQDSENITIPPTDLDIQKQKLKQQFTFAEPKKTANLNKSKQGSMKVSINLNPSEQPSQPDDNKLQEQKMNANITEAPKSSDQMSECRQIKNESQKDVNTEVQMVSQDRDINSKRSKTSSLTMDINTNNEINQQQLQKILQQYQEQGSLSQNFQHPQTDQNRQQFTHETEDLHIPNKIVQVDSPQQFIHQQQQQDGDQGYQMLPPNQKQAGQKFNMIQKQSQQQMKFSTNGMLSIPLIGQQKTGQALQNSLSFLNQRGIQLCGSDHPILNFQKGISLPLNSKIDSFTSSRKQDTQMTMISSGAQLNKSNQDWYKNMTKQELNIQNMKFYHQGQQYQQQFDTANTANGQQFGVPGAMNSTESNRYQSMKTDQLTTFRNGQFEGNQGTQQNISIGNNIKQEIILNIHVGSSDEKSDNNVSHYHKNQKFQDNRDKSSESQERQSNMIKNIQNILPNILQSQLGQVNGWIPNASSITDTSQKQNNQSQRQPSSQNLCQSTPQTIFKRAKDKSNSLVPMVSQQDIQDKINNQIQEKKQQFQLQQDKIHDKMQEYTTLLPHPEKQQITFMEQFKTKESAIYQNQQQIQYQKQTQMQTNLQTEQKPLQISEEKVQNAQVIPPVKDEPQQLEATTNNDNQLAVDPLFQCQQLLQQAILQSNQNNSQVDQNSIVKWFMKFIKDNNINLDGQNIIEDQVNASHIALYNFDNDSDYNKYDEFLEFERDKSIYSTTFNNDEFKEIRISNEKQIKVMEIHQEQLIKIQIDQVRSNVQEEQEKPIPEIQDKKADFDICSNQALIEYKEIQSKNHDDEKELEQPEQEITIVKNPQQFNVLDEDHTQAVLPLAQRKTERIKINFDTPKEQITELIDPIQNLQAKIDQVTEQGEIKSVKKSNSHKKRRGKETSNSSPKPNRGPGRPKKVKLQQMDESIPNEETVENKNLQNDLLEKQDQFEKAVIQETIEVSRQSEQKTVAKVTKPRATRVTKKQLLLRLQSEQVNQPFELEPQQTDDQVKVEQNHTIIINEKVTKEKVDNKNSENAHLVQSQVQQYLDSLSESLQAKAKLLELPLDNDHKIYGFINELKEMLMTNLIQELSETIDNQTKPNGANKRKYKLHQKLQKIIKNVQDRFKIEALDSIYKLNMKIQQQILNLQPVPKPKEKVEIVSVKPQEIQLSLQEVEVKAEDNIDKDIQGIALQTEALNSKFIKEKHSIFVDHQYPSFGRQVNPFKEPTPLSVPMKVEDSEASISCTQSMNSEPVSIRQNEYETASPIQETPNNQLQLNFKNSQGDRRTSQSVISEMKALSKKPSKIFECTSPMSIKQLFVVDRLNYFQRRQVVNSIEMKVVRPAQRKNNKSRHMKSEAQTSLQKSARMQHSDLQSIKSNVGYNADRSSIKSSTKVLTKRTRNQTDKDDLDCQLEASPVAKRTKYDVEKSDDEIAQQFISSGPSPTLQDKFASFKLPKNEPQQIDELEQKEDQITPIIQNLLDGQKNNHPIQHQQIQMEQDNFEQLQQEAAKRESEARSQQFREFQIIIPPSDSQLMMGQMIQSEGTQNPQTMQIMPNENGPKDSQLNLIKSIQQTQVTLTEKQDTDHQYPDINLMSPVQTQSEMKIFDIEVDQAKKNIQDQLKKNIFKEITVRKPQIRIRKSRAKKAKIAPSLAIEMSQAPNTRSSPQKQFTQEERSGRTDSLFSPEKKIIKLQQLKVKKKAGRPPRSKNKKLVISGEDSSSTIIAAIPRKQSMSRSQRNVRRPVAPSFQALAPNTSNNEYQLVECEKYHSFENQPFRIFFTFEVQMMMYIHSYLSKNEVIGMLGGRSYDTKINLKGSTTETVKILVITKIYTSESCIQNHEVRKVNCEISDEEQVRINEQMEKDGVSKLAWYHSHPTFDVNPSVTDLITHQHWQKNFDKDNLPFFGVIVGPYNKKQDVNGTLFNVFNLKVDMTRVDANRRQTQSNGNLKERGRAFHYRIIPKTKLKYSMYTDIKKMITNSAVHKMDRPDLAADWTTRRMRKNFSYQQKFMLSLKKISEENIQLQNNFDMDLEIRNHLLDNDERNKLELQLSSLDVMPLNQILSNMYQNQSSSNSGMGSQLPLQSIHHQHFNQEEMDQLRLGDQENNCREYFSIGDQKKISKYLFKIEQVLMKEFFLKSHIGMQQNFEGENQQNQVLLDKIPDGMMVSEQRENENIGADYTEEDANEMEQDQMVQYDLMQIQSRTQSHGLTKDVHQIHFQHQEQIEDDGQENQQNEMI